MWNSSLACSFCLRTSGPNETPTGGKDDIQRGHARCSTCDVEDNNLDMEEANDSPGFITPTAEIKRTTPERETPLSTTTALRKLRGWSLQKSTPLTRICLTNFDTLTVFVLCRTENTVGFVLHQVFTNTMSASQR